MISNPHRKEGTKMKKAYTIGIADGSAGGKSTFAQRLQAALSDLEVLLLPMDAYFKPEGDRPTGTDGAKLSGRQQSRILRPAAPAAGRERRGGKRELPRVDRGRTSDPLGLRTV